MKHLTLCGRTGGRLAQRHVPKYLEVLQPLSVDQMDNNMLYCCHKYLNVSYISNDTVDCILH